jgi:hypothetical protein
MQLIDKNTIVIVAVALGIAALEVLLIPSLALSISRSHSLFFLNTTNVNVDALMQIQQK